MSSMFKKKGGLAFKPKIPSARSRPAAPTAPSQVAKPKDTQHPVEAPSETSVQDPINSSEDSDASKKVLQPDSEATPEARIETTKESTETPPTPPEVTPASTRQDAANTKSTQADTSKEPLPNSLGGKTAPIRVSARRTTEVETSRDVETSKPTEPTEPSVTAESTKPVTNQEKAPAADHAPVPEAAEASATIQESTSASVEESAAVPTPGPLAKAPARKPRAKKNATAAVAQEPNGDATDAPKPKKRQRKAAPQEGEEASQPRPRKRKASATTDDENQQKTRRGRSRTPEDAEEQVVDLQTLKMADLTKDLHIGKKFSRHDELRDRERKARLKARLEKDGEQANGEANGGETLSADGPGGSTPGNATPKPKMSAPAPAAGPQFRIVDGQIVVDQNSLVMDRHARAAAAQAGEDMETIEENDFTRLITSSSFMASSKLRGPNIWNDQETELFYRGLRMFGTDFGIISKMFPGKERRNVKLKYNREERHNPKRITAAVSGVKTTKMDLEEYRKHTGSEFEPVETIEAEHRQRQDGFEAERQRVVDEQAEIMRKKREELFADEDGNEEGVGKKKKRGKKKGKQQVAYGLNGEPIIPGE